MPISELPTSTSNSSNRMCWVAWSPLIRRNLLAVISRRRPVGQLGDKRRIIHAFVEMGQQQLADFEVARPAEHRIEMGMGRMRLRPQAIANPDIDAFIQAAMSGVSS